MHGDHVSASITAQKEIFLHAIDLPADDREKFVATACGSRGRLRHEVTRLLDCYENINDEQCILDQGLSVETLEFVDEGIGDSIGRYEIQECIGSGGMGVVYLASDKSDLQRPVAIKVVRSELSSDLILSRFRLEQQSLAKLNHPAITQLHDTGFTESGLPYFVMEWLDGINLVQYVRKYNLPLKARLALFTTVCDAVQHAHQHGILHRDLKPSNIIVVQGDHAAIPKIIDFGLAKVFGQHQSIHDATLTQTSGFIGTPTYMSPEQAVGDVVDTRTDIYSLGVILYELLTGTTPLLSSELEGMNPLAFRETLRSARPDEPSKRVQRDIAIPADVRRSLPPTHEVGKELDCLVMKAISNEKDDRYSSASELQTDVLRYLSGEPILAVPHSLVYRTKKFIARNRLASALSTALLLTLAVSLVLVAFTNAELSVANSELSENVGQLQKAKHLIAENLSEKRFRAAFDIAFIRFNLYSSEIQSDLLQHMGDFAPVVASEEGREITDQLFDSYSPENLLGISKAEMFAKQMATMRRWISQEAIVEQLKDTAPPSHLSSLEVSKHLLPSLPDANDLFVDFQSANRQNSTPSKQELQAYAKLVETAKAYVPKSRALFFGLLLDECQGEFGLDSPETAVFFNMLSVALFDIGELKDARRTLRESHRIAIGKDLEDCEAIARFLDAKLQSEPL